MRVVMVCRKYSGIARDKWAPTGSPAVVKLIEEFERRGHKTTVLLLAKSPDRDGILQEDFTTDYGCFSHVSFTHIGWRGRREFPSIASDILNDTRQFLLALPYFLRGADVFYFDRAHLGLAALMSLFRRNVVWRCLGVMSFLIARDAGKRAGAFYLGLARLLVRFPIRLMVCTNDGSPWFRLFPRSSRDRLLLLTNGVDRPAADAVSLNKRDDVPVIGFVGRTTLTKGLDTFIEVCTELRRRSQLFRAVVVGDGHFLKDAIRMAHDLGVGSSIEFTGSVPHTRIREYFRTIDIYVTPARNGAFSNTTLEALTSGCSIVALSPTPGTGVDVTTMAFLPADLVRWADRDRSVSGFADCICDLLAMREELALSRARGVAFARDTLSDWQKRIRLEADLLESVVANAEIPSGALPNDLLSQRAFEVVA